MHNRQFHTPVLPQEYRNNIHDISYEWHQAVSLVLVACVYVWFVSLVLQPWFDSWLVSLLFSCVFP